MRESSSWEKSITEKHFSLFFVSLSLNSAIWFSAFLSHYMSICVSSWMCVFLIYAYLNIRIHTYGFLGDSVKKPPAMQETNCNAGDLSSIPGSGRSPREENGYPLQYSCLGNPMDKEACWAIVCGVPKSWANTQNIYTYIYIMSEKCEEN